MPNKHIIIAGTCRSGKTTLSLELAKLGYVHYKMDSIKRGICEIFNVNQHDWKKISPKIAQLMSIIIKENFTDTVTTKELYVLDTCHLFPKDINLLNLNTTIIIFLGYSNITVEDKLEEMHKYDKDNYWSRNIPDKQLIQMISYNIKFSKYLQDQCKQLNIPYFDTSFNRDEVLNSAKEFILTKNKL